MVDANESGEETESDGPEATAARRGDDAGSDAVSEGEVRLVGEPLPLLQLTSPPLSPAGGSCLPSPFLVAVFP